MITQILSKTPTLVFGCGNTLFGDDGFGPETIKFLNDNYTLPETVVAVDMGTSIRDYLFDLLLSDKRPDTIIILDAVTISGRQHGELFELDPDRIPGAKKNDFSLHQFPTVNLLQELHTETGVNIIVLAVQTNGLPERVCPGLSPEIEKAVPKACEWLMAHIV